MANNNGARRARRAAKKTAAKKKAAKKRATKKQTATHAGTKRTAKKQPAKQPTKKRAVTKQPAKPPATKRGRSKPTAPTTPGTPGGVSEVWEQLESHASTFQGPTPKSKKEEVATPWSSDRRPTVAVFGAGIAGLTAAHELAERGFDVTVYEAVPDTRQERADSREVPKVRLGGLAATQYVTPDKLRPFGGTKLTPKALTRVASGEHGFRFFPAYYLHIWDTLRRIPIYDENDRPTTRTVYDNVIRVIAQAGTAPNGQPSLILPREWPRSLAELAGSYQEVAQLGFTPSDLSIFFGRVARYLVTSPERRGEELEEVSTYDYLIGYDPVTQTANFSYSQPFSEQIFNMPRILAAFDARYGDARTNMSTYVQLNMLLDRYDSKADGVLNGPTTDAWFDPWYDHLTKLHVKFEPAALISFAYDHRLERLRATISRDLSALDADAEIAPDDLALAHFPKRGDEVVEADYFVAATDAFRAELVTTYLREQQYDDHDWLPRGLLTDLNEDEGNKRQALRNMSTVLGLEGFTTMGPPDDDPYGPNVAVRRNPFDVASLGKTRWDRFQTLSGVQFFFDTEFQVLNGHVYYSTSDWRLSSINSTGLWSDKPRLDRDGYVSLMSIDIGDWTTPSGTLGKSALQCTADELATEVWRQVSSELGRSIGEVEDFQFPQPRWYSIDTFIEYDAKGYAKRNRAPYLIPIKADWKNRPGAYPWNPNGTSPVWLPLPDTCEAQSEIDVWQAGHGGYHVHFGRLVFAGTWCKTFTRMTSMEAACEAGRHAVNAILDHYIHAQTGDERTADPAQWRMPFGFVDQELSSPIRLPTPAGDYAFIFDCENREPSDARPTRVIDGDCWAQGLPHPWTLNGIDQATIAAANVAAASLYDPSLIIEQLRLWRQVVESVFAAPSTREEPRLPDVIVKYGRRSSPADAGMYCKGVRVPPPASGSGAMWMEPTYVMPPGLGRRQRASPRRSQTTRTTGQQGANPSGRTSAGHRLFRPPDRGEGNF
jgi:uncharacterized protein with NAD-binding domain and iron-sulfur cluster